HSAEQPSCITRDALLKKRGEATSETYLQAIAKGAWGSYGVLSRRAAGLRPALLRYAQKSWFVIVVTRVLQHRDTTFHPRHHRNATALRTAIRSRGRWLTITTRSGHP